MDRRSFFMVLFFTLTLLGVNFYFDSQRQEQWQQWNLERVAKLKAERSDLLREVESRQLAPEQMPVYLLYSDKEGKELFGYGAGQATALLAIPFDQGQPWPETLYARRFGQAGGGSELEKLELRWNGSPQASSGFYSSEEGGKLSAAQFNYFNDYDLYLLLAEGSAPSFGLRTLLAEYQEGRFGFPSDRIMQLSREMGEEPSSALPPSQKPADREGIVLVRQGATLLPVALFDGEKGQFLPLTTLELLEPHLKMAVAAQQQVAAPTEEERYFVLENGFQQLVFSSRGGALVEINLPLQDSAHPDSIVKAIEADRLMVEKVPSNGRFPAHPYTIANEQGELQQEKEGHLGGYYPLLRRDLLIGGGKGRDVPPRFYATNIVSVYPEVAQLPYRLKELTANKIVLEAQQPHRRITKSYSIEGTAPYTFELEVQIEGDRRGLWMTSGVAEAEIISNGPAPALKYRLVRQGKGEVKELELPSEASTYSQLQPEWFSSSNGFFALIMNPLFRAETGLRTQFVSGQEVPSRLTLVEEAFDEQKLPGYMGMIGLEGAKGQTRWRFFAGPLATGILKEVDGYYEAKSGLSPDYLGAQSEHGYFAFISGPFAKFLFFLMELFYWVTGSWGLSIILLTVALRILLYPLNRWSMRSSLKMQQLMPQIQALQEQHKGDPKKKQEKLMELYREGGVNPLSGCLPLLIQLPFLIGMFDLLKTSFVLRGASFIPGWIDNLAAPDVLFSWELALPFIGNQFHLLPLISGAVMLMQQRMMTPVAMEGGELNEKQRQQRAAGTIMAVVFTVMFYNFPSGINIYWISSSLIGMLQQWWMGGRLSVAKPETTKEAAVRRSSSMR